MPRESPEPRQTRARSPNRRVPNRPDSASLVPDHYPFRRCRLRRKYRDSGLNRPRRAWRAQACYPAACRPNDPASTRVSRLSTESASRGQPGRRRGEASPARPCPDPPGQGRNRRPAPPGQGRNRRPAPLDRGRNRHPAWARKAPDRSAARAPCPASKAADRAGADRPASARHSRGRSGPRRRPSRDRHAARRRPRRRRTDARQATQTHHRHGPSQPDRTAIPRTGSDPDGSDPDGSDPPGSAVAGFPARIGPRRPLRQASRGASASPGGPIRRWAAAVPGPRRPGPRPCRRRPRRPPRVPLAGA